MSEANAITLAFLARQPRAAAGLARRYPPEQAAEFFRDAPPASLIPVMREMASWPAAQVISRFPTPLAADILRELSAAKSETLLRLVDAETRENVLRHLPKSLAKRFQRKLIYPAGTTGAWMDASPPHFTPDDSVADCIDLVRQRQESLGGVLAVVDYDRKLVGMVELEQLLTSDENTLLSELTTSDVEPLSARSTLGEALNYKEWTRFSALPVVDRNNILLGVLTYRALLAGKAGQRRPDSDDLRFSLIANLGRAFLVTVTGLLSLERRLSGHADQGVGLAANLPAGEKDRATND